MTKHQQNYARILSLRQTADSLDAQVKNGLTQLADVRKELTSASLTAPPKASRDVPIDELIAYAQRISRYTVPPTYRPLLPLPLTKQERVEDPAKLANGTPGSAQPETTPVGAGATAIADGEGRAAGRQDAITSPVAVAGQEENRGTGWAHLSEDQRAWLDSINRLQYVPWPSDNDVKSGALARIQAMREQGMDPATMTKTKAELEEEARAKEEQERQELEALRERQRRGSVAGRRPNVQAGGNSFGLDLYDPDEG